MRLCLLVEVGGKPNRPPLGSRRVEELTDRGEHGGDGLVMRGELLLDARLELIEALGELLVGGEQLAQLHEGAHDVDAYLNRAIAVEDVGGLDRTVLGENAAART